MIYLFYGNDENELVDEGNSLVEKLLQKKPDAVVINFSSIDESFLKEHTNSQGLFNAKYILKGRNIFKENFDLIEDYLQDLKSSENIFIFLESDMTDKIFKKIEKFIEKAKEFSKNKTKSDYNAFSITNYLNDKKNLWIKYHEAKENGISDEQIHGILFWKAKTSKPELLGDLVEVFHQARRGKDMSVLLESWILKNK